MTCSVLLVDYEAFLSINQFDHHFFQRLLHVKNSIVLGIFARSTQCLRQEDICSAQKLQAVFLYGDDPRYIFATVKTQLNQRIGNTIDFDLSSPSGMNAIAQNDTFNIFLLSISQYFIESTENLQWTMFQLSVLEKGTLKTEDVSFLNDTLNTLTTTRYIDNKPKPWKVVFCLDIDETLIYYDLSVQRYTLVFNKHVISFLHDTISYCKSQEIAYTVKIVTARLEPTSSSPEFFSNHFLSVRNIVQELFGLMTQDPAFNPRHIMIHYERDKFFVLKKIYGENQNVLVVLLDDQLGNLYQFHTPAYYTSRVGPHPYPHMLGIKVSGQDPLNLENCKAQIHAWMLACKTPTESAVLHL